MLSGIRFALRTLGKQPLFAAIVILTLALGIGTDTAVFSVLDAVLLRPLQFREPQSLVALLLAALIAAPMIAPCARPASHAPRSNCCASL